MSINSFKELLAKKASDNSKLLELLPLIKDEVIVDMVVESLEKMATIGHGSHGPAAQFAHEMGNDDISYLRHYLSHHISHYKAALKNGQRDLADKHLEKIVPALATIGQAAENSPIIPAEIDKTGKITNPDEANKRRLNFEAPSLRPWESNYTSHLTRQQAFDLGLRPPLEQRNGKEIDPHMLQREHHGHGTRPSKSIRSPFGIPDYRYLEMPRNQYHNMTSKEAEEAGLNDEKQSISSAPKLRATTWTQPKHNGGYPFEQIRVGSPTEMKNGYGYVHIDDELPKQEGFVPHPYDEHPLFAWMNKNKSDKGLMDIPGKHEKDVEDWRNNHESNVWQMHDDHADRHGEDTHKTMSPHFFKDIPLKPQSDAGWYNKWKESGMANDVETPQQESAASTTRLPTDLPALKSKPATATRLPTDLPALKGTTAQPSMTLEEARARWGKKS